MTRLSSRGVGIGATERISDRKHSKDASVRWYIVKEGRKIVSLSLSVASDHQLPGGRLQWIFFSRLNASIVSVLKIDRTRVDER